MTKAMVIPKPVLEGEEWGGKENEEEAEWDDMAMLIPIPVLEREEWGGEEEEEEAEWDDKGDGDGYSALHAQAGMTTFGVTSTDESFTLFFSS
jgi:hypothetical protein